MNPDLLVILFYLYAFITSICLLVFGVALSQEKEKRKAFEHQTKTLSIENTVLRQIVYEKNDVMITVQM